MRLLFFVPSFDDHHVLGDIVNGLLRRYPYSKVLIIDDGSQRPIALDSASSNVIVYRMPFNVGLGTSTSVAIDYCIDHDYDFMVRIDADGQHPIDEVGGLLGPLQQDMADIVWGERHNNCIKDSSRHLLASFVKNATAWSGKVIFSSPINDWYTGFFSLNKSAMNLVSKVHLERYCEVQLLSIFYQNKMRVVSHGIEQLDRQHGKSTIGWLEGAMILLRSAVIMILYGLGMYPR